MVELEGHGILKPVAGGKFSVRCVRSQVLLPQFRRVRLDVNRDVDGAFYLLIKGSFQAYGYFVGSRYLQVRVDMDVQITVHGLDTPVSQQELVDGYLRQSDYTRKTKELS